ncbi:hypothetical protein PYCCODRAFT_761052 [Trametes coccinea BRFM310]|uniref:Uncharacterized protein n=1 Tax=Trametes coccinea (strain BRFM310) TaxID=1353009 RepID=A0A1Y2J055_TRAC3|nr:hypothetical protein PYCCODRAFT_761052 [Trametes coccinea BRFM310]
MLSVYVAHHETVVALLHSNHRLASFRSTRKMHIVTRTYSFAASWMLSSMPSGSRREAVACAIAYAVFNRPWASRMGRCGCGCCSGNRSEDRDKDDQFSDNLHRAYMKSDLLLPCPTNDAAGHDQTQRNRQWARHRRSSFPYHIGPDVDDVQ